MDLQGSIHSVLVQKWLFVAFALILIINIKDGDVFYSV